MKNDGGIVFLSDVMVEEPSKLSFFNDPSIGATNLYTSMITLLDVYSDDENVSDDDKAVLTYTMELLKNELGADDLHISMLLLGELETYATDLDSILMYSKLLSSAYDEAVVLENLDA